MRRSFMLPLTLLSLLPVAVQSQTCLGLPSFSSVPAHLSGTLTTGGDVTTIGGGISWGGAGPFVGVTAAFVDIDGFDENAFTVGGSLGYQISASGANRSTARMQSSNVRSIQWCPIANIEYQIGPEFDVLGEKIDLSALSVAGGVALGVPIDVGTNFQLIPTGGASFAYTKISADAEAFGVSESESETYGVISLGLGFLMNETLSIKPFVAIPVGLEDADSRFGISVSFGLGRRG